MRPEVTPLGPPLRAARTQLSRPRTAVLAVMAAAGLAAVLPDASAGPASQTPRATEGARAAGTVVGTVWDRDNAPLPHARVQLRSVATGRVVATSQADAGGRFSFAGVPEGRYVVELVEEHGRVMAVGPVFHLLPGETASTFVRLSTRVRWFSGFFNNAALAAMAAAAALGLTAVADSARPASPRF